MPSVIEWQGQKIDVDGTLRELDRVDCEESLSTFLMHAWRYVVGDGVCYIHGWVVDAVAEHLEAVCDGDIRRLIINIPPRCLKSTMCSVCFPAWIWAQQNQSPTSGPSVPVLHTSYAYNLAIRDSIKRRRLIKSPWYQALWGDRFQIVPDQDQKIRFSNNKGGESLITSVEASVTGEGGNIIIVDDPNNAKEALSEAVIKATNDDWWDGTMSTRLNDAKTGAIIVIQQRLGEQDLTGHILEKDDAEDWTQLVLPMEFETWRKTWVSSIGWQDPRNEEGELLWPERFGTAEVRKLENNLRKWRAAGQLQQRPEPAGGGIIKREWWRLWPPEGERLGPNRQPIKAVHYPPFTYIVASLDTAHTEKTINDPSALTIWGIFDGPVVSEQVQTAPATDHQPALYGRVEHKTSACAMLVYAWTGHMEIHDLVNHVHRLCGPRSRGGYDVDMLLIENKANGISVSHELRRLFSSKADYAIRVREPTAGEGYSSNSKVARLYSVQNVFEEGMIWSPERSWSDAVIAQCATVPNARHDDLADTVSQAIKYLREIGILVRGEEYQIEAEESIRFMGRQPPPLYPA